MIDWQKINVQVEILGCKGAKKTKNNMGMRWLGGLFTDEVCTGSVSYSDSWCLKLVREIWVSSFSGDFCFLKIFAIHSSHWQQRTGRKGGQMRNWLWGWPVKYSCWSTCNGWVLLWWPVSWDKAGLYLAKTYRVSGIGDENEARASQWEHAGRNGG